MFIVFYLVRSYIRNQLTRFGYSDCSIVKVLRMYCYRLTKGTSSLPTNLHRYNYMVPDVPLIINLFVNVPLARDVSPWQCYSRGSGVLYLESEKYRPTITQFPRPDIHENTDPQWVDRNLSRLTDAFTLPQSRQRPRAAAIFNDLARERHHQIRNHFNPDRPRK